MNPLRVPRQRSAALWPWAEGLGRWLRISSLRLHEQQLLGAISRIELLGDLDGCPHTLPRLRSRLAEVQADLARQDPPTTTTTTTTTPTQERPS